MGPSLLCSLAFQSVCGVPVDVEPYGAGTPGALGVPLLHAADIPTLGGPFALEVAGAEPGTPGLVGLSSSPANLPLPGTGGELLLGGVPLLVPFVVGPTGLAPSLLSLEVPDSLCGVTLHSQAVLLDPLAASGLALTRGIGITFGEFSGPLTIGEIGGDVVSAGDIDLADLDLDGDLDAFVVSGSTSSLENPGTQLVFFNDGGGRFEAGPAYGDLPQSAGAVGDLNGDGLPDLVSVRFAADGIRVSLGVDGERWEPLPLAASGGAASDVALSDLTGDGVLDLGVVLQSERTLRLFRGLGDGTFAVLGSVGLDLEPIQLDVLDLDGDGLLDAVVLGRLGGLEVLRGEPGGGFEGPEPIAPEIAGERRGASYVDLDGDGLRDLVTWLLEGTITVRLGTASGYGPTGVYVVEGSGADLEVLDFDLDGALDLLVACFPTEGPALLRGNGDGTFGAPSVLPPGAVTALAAGDLDGNGTGDVFANFGFSTAMAALLSLEALELADLRLDLGTGPGDGSAVAVELDPDGRVDLLAANWTAETVSVLRGQGSGQFDPAEVLAIDARPWLPRAADLDGDGDQDAVFATVGAGYGLRVLRNDGAGNLTVEQPIGTPITIRGLLVEDLDLDGIDELLVYGTGLVNVQVWDLSVADVPTLSSEREVAFGLASADLADLDGDGFPDLVYHQGPSQLGVFFARGQGDGSFAEPTLAINLDLDHELVLEDVDGDGSIELVLAAPDLQQVRIHQSTGPGTFGDFEPISIGQAATSVQILDVDGDGHLDLLAVGDTLAVVRADGQGGWLPSERYLIEPSFESDLRLADLDQDGALDLYWVGDGEVVVRRSVVLD